MTGIVPYASLDTASPVAAALLAVGVRWASAMVSAGAIAGLTSVLLVNIYAQSRIFFAMARDGLLPPVLATVSRGRRAPYKATLVTGAAVALIGGLLPIEVVAELANIGTLGAFILVSAGVIALRHLRPDLKRPFRTPWVPVLPGLAILFSLYLMLSLPRLTWIRFFVWLVIGFLIYFGYGRHHSRLAQRPELAEPGAEEPGRLGHQQRLR